MTSGVFQSGPELAAVTTPEKPGPAPQNALGVMGRERLRGVMDKLAERAKHGHRAALYKLAELLVDESVVESFTEADRTFIYHRALEALDKAQAKLGPYQFWALIMTLARHDLWKRCARILGAALRLDQAEALAMLRKAVRVPGLMAERVADILARFPKKLDDNDLLAVGVRALQSGRHGRSRDLLERGIKKGQSSAVQAVRSLLWRQKDFIDLDHNEARLQAALALISRRDLIAAEDLPHLRAAARHAGGEPLFSLYEAMDELVDQRPVLDGALSHFAGLLNDVELSDDPRRGDILFADARSQLVQRFSLFAEDLSARRDLAPLTLLWAEDNKLRAEAVRLLQRPVVDGDAAAISAAAALFSRPRGRPSLDISDQALSLLRTAAEAGHAVEVVARLLDELQREQEAVDPRLFDALAECSPVLPMQSMLRVILLETLRDEAQSTKLHHKDARRALNQFVVSASAANEKTEVRDPAEHSQVSRVNRIVKVRGGLD